MPAAALVPNPTPTSPQSRSAETTTTDPEKPASRSPEASVTGATRDASPAPARKAKAAGPTSTPSSFTPSTAINDPHTSKTSLDPQKSQDAKVCSQLNGWQARMCSKVASEMQVSSEKAKDSSIQDLSPPNTETSREPLDAIRPSEVSSDQKSDPKATLSPNSVVSDPLSTSEERYEDGATRPLTRTAQTPSPEDDPGRAGASFVPDTSPSHDSLRQGSKHSHGTSTAEAGSLRLDGQSNGDISTDPGSGSGPASSLIDHHSQTQSPAPALGHNQTTTAAQAAFQPPSNNTNTNTNTDPNTNMSSTASGRRGGGGGGGARPSSTSSRGGTSDGTASSVLPFQNGGDEKGTGVVVWIVGLGGCVGVMFPLYVI